MALRCRTRHTRPMNLRRFLVPHFEIRWIPSLLGISLLGALAAGLYGILHDQVTYSISPEYFTNVKYLQFDYLNPDLPDRVRVAQIGFLATWGMGFIGAWFMARLSVPRHPFRQALRLCLFGFAIMFAATLAAGMIGWTLGEWHGPDYGRWEPFIHQFGVEDLPAFVQVAYIHNAGYMGAFTGLLAALVLIWRRRDGVSPRLRGASSPTARC